MRLLTFAITLSCILLWFWIPSTTNAWTSRIMATPAVASSRRRSTTSSALASSSSRSSATTTTSVDSTLASPSPETSTISLDSIVTLQYLPQIIVFDLDNTLWTPELYQIRQRTQPKANVDIRLFPDAVTILEFLARQQHKKKSTNQASESESTWPVLAIASRTSKIAWANQLLDEFVVEDRPLRQHFQHILIQTGSKKKHMEQLIHLHAKTTSTLSSISYRDMLFFDDDARMNLGEVSRMGVLCCHTPRGITTEHFVKSLHHYHTLKQQAISDSSSIANAKGSNVWMGYVLNHQSLGIVEPHVEVGQECHGRIKFYSPIKKFGFVIDNSTGQELFVHESKIPSTIRKLQPGDQVIFQATQDSSGRASAVLISFATSTADQSNGNAPRRTRPNRTSPSEDTNFGDRSSTTTPTQTMLCFSMSQPFVALLLNGCKTIESRNNPMFANISPGTRLLVHCGQRDWPDTTSYQQYLSQEATTKDVTRLPKGFFKGSIVGCVTIGKTWWSTEQERQSWDLQRRVLAPAAGIGKYCTEIAAAQWLKQPYKMRGNVGVYEVELPLDCLPDNVQ